MSSSRKGIGKELVRGTAREVRLFARGWRWGRRPLVPRSAQPYTPAPGRKEFPTRWARSPGGVALREVVQRVGLGPLLRFEVEPRVYGLDVLDGLRSPVIFVANHSSHLDTPMVLCTLPDSWRRRTAVAAAADYFFDTWWRAAGSAIVFNTLPLERRGGQSATTPGEVLDEGWNLLWFPEGTRSPDGWVTRFRLGAAYLAAQYGVPIVPIGLRGAYAAMPRGRGWPVAGRPPVRIRYGRPLTLAAGEEPRDFAKRVSAAVAQLLDEDETSWWSAMRRAADGTTPSPTGPAVAPWRRIWAQTAPPEVPRRRQVWAKKRKLD
ncbi:MAG: 1-acyl-sn-glycerol-3-phosphate acyltransferase [Streptosporangiales bacterium]|nr:1-acyl-sn-glycerol-3-phosphate acyltransferase [Streptosporangiales bacterium]